MDQPFANAPVSRRSFIYRTALATGATVITGCATSASKRRRVSPNEKLNIAIIGAGGRGATDANEVSSENIVALCDVNEINLAVAAKKFPAAKQFVDFRELYDRSKDFDAVVVATTEHTHAFAVLSALRLGKHVYCEKPLAHCVWECRFLASEARKAKVVTQMGTQMHAQNNFRRVVETIQSGAIGPVREVHVWVSRAWGDGSRPTETPPVPKTLHWDLWIAGAPKRPFHPSYINGQPRWYKYWDFGGGTLPDLGSHWNDLIFWALKLDAPRTIEAFGPPPNPETAPASYRVVYEHGARDNMPALKRVWYQGEEKPAIWTEKKIPQWENGMLFIGDNGMLLSNYNKHVLLPEEKFADFKRPEPTIPDSRAGHWMEWVNACKTGKPASCDFSYSGPLTEANHLGNVAYRVGKKIEWDAAKLKAKNCPEADKYIRVEYHNGWKLA
jgi:predicted dehydrogenase